MPNYKLPPLNGATGQFDDIDNMGTLDPMQVDLSRDHYDLPPMTIGIPQHMDINRLLAMQRAKKAAQADFQQKVLGQMHYADEGGILPAEGSTPYSAFKDQIPPDFLPPGRIPVSASLSPEDLKMLREMSNTQIAR